MESNYEKQVYMAREYFLKYDQDMLIEKFGLKNDENYLYLRYIAADYRIRRSDGAVEQMLPPGEYQLCTEYTVVMTIYDLICHSGNEKLVPLTGQWQPVGRFVISGSSPDTGYFTKKYAAAFSDRIEEVKKACASLGGVSLPRLAGADVSFKIQAVEWLPVIFQFWEGDDEFPPKVLILWDKASMSYLNFETTYYLQGDLLERILSLLDGRETLIEKERPNRR